MNPHPANPSEPPPDPHGDEALTTIIARSIGRTTKNENFHARAKDVLDSLRSGNCEVPTPTRVIDKAAADAVATVKRSSVGPYLLIAGVEARSWLGTNHDNGADKLAADINAALAARAGAKDATIARLSAELTEAREALEDADCFITNGIEFGFIRMPDPDTPDTAHETPRHIRAVLAKLSEGA